MPHGERIVEMDTQEPTFDFDSVVREAKRRLGDDGRPEA